jgi:DNA-binding LytR/AlgR family response regulator
MSGIRVLIADDEPLARSALRVLVERAEGFEVAGEAANGIEAVESIEELRPDVAFLDIEMPGLGGFEVIEHLRPPAPRVVFVTAYDQYAVRAFEAAALDYVLKPISEGRLEFTLGRIRAALAAPGAADYEGVLRRVLAGLARSPGDPTPAAPRRLAARQGKRIVLLSLREATHFAIDDALVFAFTRNGRFLVEKTIAEIEQWLEPAGFFRISRGAIVNLDYVRELTPWFSGTWKVKLASGEELDVSRERARQLKERLGL